MTFLTFLIRHMSWRSCNRCQVTSIFTCGRADLWLCDCTQSGVGQVERLWNCQSYSSMSKIFVIRGNCHVHWQYEFYIVLPKGLRLLQPVCSVHTYTRLYAMLSYVIYVPLQSSYDVACVTGESSWISGATQILGFPLVALLRFN